MKILFISGGNFDYGILPYGISPFIKGQGESLREQNLDIDYFLIKGQGVTGYIKNIPKLRKVIRDNKYDAVHSHFSKSGYVAFLALFGLKTPIIQSLLGSDVQEVNFLGKIIVKFFIKFIWEKTIVKSKRMKNTLGIKKIEVIPNGLNLKNFLLLDKDKTRKELNLDENKKILIWVSNPDRQEKNFLLAKNAVEILKDKNVILKVVNGVKHYDIYKYMNAADVLLLTSFSEGSPNVVKEAMACNLPIVSTDVGDVEDVIKGVQGCYLGSYEPKEFAEQIKKAITFGKRTTGRNKIDYLDEKKIAAKIIKLYNDVKKER